ncbi:hypothetical protein F4777DRAFT_572012 [Nemania sp. FL0916]|nr:hypothetical protein F4777DRAFT_572012 [Nemania sp. FL0916]
MPAAARLPPRLAHVFAFPRPQAALRQRPLRRTFLNSILPSSPPLPTQTLTARRRLPYNHAALYRLIVDIDSYSAFLPYCSASRVTAWTTTAGQEDGRRWPTRADLTAGWGGLEQTFTSRVVCVPGSIVEALSGAGARSGIPAEVLARHGLHESSSSASPTTTSGSGEGEEEGVFKTLVTRWTVSPVPAADQATEDAGVGSGGPRTEWSDVDLNIRFQFANPLYAAVSSAVADKVAPLMIEAFVERAKKVLG